MPTPEQIDRFIATWLVNTHRALDDAVAAAYGWPADPGDDEVLRRLLAMNQKF